MQRKLIFNIMLLVFLSIMPAISYADDPDDGEFDDEEPDNVPIDGGISLLVGAAAVYGAKKLKDHKDKEKMG